MESSKTPGTGGTWLRRAALRLRSLFDRGALERELDDEMRDHVEREAAALVRQGMPYGTARLEALRRFGGVERYKEHCRDERGVRPIDELRQDVGYALRAFRRSPAFTLVVTLTLALGIGATTAVFTAVRGVLLRQLPFDEPDRLVHLWSSAPAKDFPRAWVSLPDFEDWRRQSSTMERMDAYAALGSGLVLVHHPRPP